MGLVITLVHGTFGRWSGWLDKDSLLCRSLQSCFPGSVRLCLNFRWSGLNSPYAREKAAKKLRQHLHAVIDECPADVHIVIGHSHGGNVALYAIKDTRLADKIGGVICLSTPFLHATRRELGFLPPGSVKTGLLLLFCTLGLIVGYYLNCFTPIDVIGELDRPSFVLCIVALTGPMFLLLFLFKMWSKNAEGLLNLMSYPQLPPQKVFIIRTHADEAMGLIASGSFLSWFSTRPLALLSGWYLSLLQFGDRIDTSLRRMGFFLINWIRLPFLSGVATIALFPLVPASYFVAMNIPSLQQVQIVDWMIVMTLLLWAYLSVLISIGIGGRKGIFDVFEGIITFIPGIMLAPFLVFTSIFAIFPLGIKLALYYSFLEVTAEPVPPGSWNIYQVEEDSKKTSMEEKVMKAHKFDRAEIQLLRPPGFLHASYSNPRAIESVTRWIRNIRGLHEPI